MTSNGAQAVQSEQWTMVCNRDDLIEGAGVAALVDGRQIAIFCLPDPQGGLYAVGNFDPIGRANVISRGIIGDIDGEPVVASPLYKQHFSLLDGRALEDEAHSLPCYPVALKEDSVWVSLGEQAD